ncbi:TPA: hypothetical protein EYO57_04700 [Candidatus Poribacteria bacterium]|nr:hypothetical protein [Candidatus Poribacteria bacterium]
MGRPKDLNQLLQSLNRGLFFGWVMLIIFLFSAGVLENNVVLAQDQSENFGYLYIETDPPDAVIRIDRELRRAQKRRPEEIETKQKADTVKPIGNPVPLIRAADVGHDRILVRSSRSFAVGDTVRIEQNQDGNLPKRVSDHEIVRIGVVDAIPALFIRPPLINTFETTTGEVGESGNARIFKINPPKSPRIFAVPVVAPAYLAEDVEPGASQIKVYISSIASRNDFPVKSAISIQKIDNSEVYAVLTQKAKATAQQIYVGDTSKFASGDIVEIAQGEFLFRARIKQVYDQINKIELVSSLSEGYELIFNRIDVNNDREIPLDEYLSYYPSAGAEGIFAILDGDQNKVVTSQEYLEKQELRADDARVNRIQAEENTEIIGIPEKEVEGAPGAEQKLRLTITLKDKLKRGYPKSAQVLRMSKLEIDRPFYLPEKRTVLIRAGEVTKVPILKMTRGAGSITVISDPSGATLTLKPQFSTEKIYLDQLTKSYETPVTISNIPAGSYHLKLVAGKYSLEEISSSVPVTDQRVTELDKCLCSQTFRNELRSAGIEVPSKVLVTLVQESRHWLVSDVEQDNRYSVLREDNKLIISSVTVFIGDTTFIKRELRMDDNAPIVLPNGFLINGGSSQTSSSIVRLSFAITDQSGVSKMMISNNKNFQSRIDQIVEWEPFSSSKKWNINSHPGEKKVWVKFRDWADNETKTFSSSIELVPPLGMIYISRNDQGFLMGNATGEEDEKPEHEVTLSSYFIGRFEVTNAEYKEFVDATAHPIPPHWVDGGYPAGMASYPVVFVSWYDATRYCNWLSESANLPKSYSATGELIDKNGAATNSIEAVEGYRLPTEAEWERTALGSAKLGSSNPQKDNRTFWPWGDRWNGLVTNFVNPVDGMGIMPVSRFAKGQTEDGLYNMCGNVWEWVSDWYSPGYYPAPRFNPIGPGPIGKEEKVIRGGLEVRNGQITHLTNRKKAVAEEVYGGIGFRYVLSITDQQ